MPLAENYLMFVPDDERWIAPEKGESVIEVWDRGVLAGTLSLNKNKVSFKGDMKLIFKHILLMLQSTQIAGKLTNATPNFRDDPNITTSLDLEMKTAEVIVFLRSYRPSIMFVFFGRQIDISHSTPQLKDMCHACFIGHQQFPSFSLIANDFVKSRPVPYRMDERTFDAVIGLITMEHRLLVFPENKFGDEIKRKRKASSIEPEFQVILVQNKQCFLFCEVYPERDT